MNTNTKDVHVSKQETAKRSGRLYRVSGNLLICKATIRAIPRNFVNTSRGSVHGFTAGAAQRMRRYLRECMAEYSNMVTLTYPGFFDTDGTATKNDLRRLLQEFKRRIESECGTTSIYYSSFWFLEFQERGAPHFHIFTTHYFDKDWVSRTWYRIVNSEDPRHLHAGTRCEKLNQGRSGTISYASKYAVKQCQKVVPENYQNVGRFWGVSGYRATMSADTFVSKDDRKSLHIRNLEKQIGKVVEVGVFYADIEVLKRDRGVGVYVLHKLGVVQKLRLLVSRLSAQTQRLPQLFQDAELNVEA